jgi:hypothetical protein
VPGIGSMRVILSKSASITSTGAELRARAIPLVRFKSWSSLSRSRADTVYYTALIRYRPISGPLRVFFRWRKSNTPWYQKCPRVWVSGLEITRLLLSYSILVGRTIHE